MADLYKKMMKRLYIDYPTRFGFGREDSQAGMFTPLELTGPMGIGQTAKNIAITAAVAIFSAPVFIVGGILGQLSNEASWFESVGVGLIIAVVAPVWFTIEFVKETLSLLTRSIGTVFSLIGSLCSGDSSEVLEQNEGSEFDDLGETNDVSNDKVITPRLRNFNENEIELVSRTLKRRYPSTTSNGSNAANSALSSGYQLPYARSSGGSEVANTTITDNTPTWLARPRNPSPTFFGNSSSSSENNNLRLMARSASPVVTDDADNTSSLSIIAYKG